MGRGVTENPMHKLGKNGNGQYLTIGESIKSIKSDFTIIREFLNTIKFQLNQTSRFKTIETLEGNIFKLIFHDTNRGLSGR